MRSVSLEFPVVPHGIPFRWGGPCLSGTYVELIPLATSVARARGHAL